MLLEGAIERRFAKIKDVGNFPVIAAGNGIDCIDSRDPDFGKFTCRNEKAICAPGASAGRVVAVMAAAPKMDPLDAVDLVSNFENEGARKFSFHTAQIQVLDGFGCAHVDQAILHASEYGVNQDKLKLAMTYVRRKKSYRRGIEVLNLQGEHEEKAVVIVNSTCRTIDRTKVTNRIFRYDQERNDEALSQLAWFCKQLHGNMEGYHLDANTLVETFHRQADISVGILANGLAIWSVDVGRLWGPKVNLVRAAAIKK